MNVALRNGLIAAMVATSAYEWGTGSPLWAVWASIGTVLLAAITRPKKR